MIHALYTGEHQMELLDCVAAKFHEEPGVFKLLVRVPTSSCVETCLCVVRLWIPSWPCFELILADVEN